jgi:hypothetical protein
MILADQRFGPLFGSSDSAKIFKIVMDIRNGMRRHPDDFRRVAKNLEHARNFIAGGRANLAKILRQDVCRRQFAKQALVEMVKTLAGAKLPAYRRVDFPGRHRFERQCAMNHDRFVANFRRVIAPMRNRDNGIGQAQRAGQFRRRRKQRCDAKIFHVWAGDATNRRSASAYKPNMSAV